MHKLNRFYLSLLLLLVVSFGAFAQMNTSSPYSKFGFGELYSDGLGYSKGMGGIGVGTRMKNQINFLNPAAYTTQDTLSFILDFGLNYGITNYETNSAIFQRINSGFSHLAISFPITKWWVASLGTTPYSKMGYNLSYGAINPVINRDVEYKYQGRGGLNRYYFGSGFAIGDFSFGVNANYLLGSLETTSSYAISTQQGGNPLENYYPTTLLYKHSIRNMYFSFGTQYVWNIKPDITAVFGVTYEPQTKVKSYSSKFAFYDYPNTSNSSDTVSFEEEAMSSYAIPSKFGFGTSLNIREKFLISMDYHRQDWTNYKFPLSDSNNSLAVPTFSQSYNFGVQYTPNVSAIRGYLNHVSFRAGLRLNDTYMKINGENIKDYGVSCGLGLPFLNSRSVFNISYEYGQRGTLNNSLVRETNHFVYLNLTLFDFWFIKSKFD